MAKTKRKAVKKQKPSQQDLTVHDRRAYNVKFATLKRQMRALRSDLSALRDQVNGVG